MVSHWTANDGLPSNALTNVHQTRDGFLWLASFDGLFRFDGLTFTAFDRRSTLAFEANGLHELTETATGELWLGTRGGGLMAYRDGFEILAGGGEAGHTVRAVLPDAAGSAWVGTNDHGVFRYLAVQDPDARWRPAEHSELNGVSVRAILEDRDGDLWFGTEGRGLIRLSKDTTTGFSVDSGLASEVVTSLLETADGTLWVGTERGLSRIVGGSVDPVVELEGVEVYRLAEDGHGSLWIAAEQGLWRRQATGEPEHLDRLDGTPLRSVSGIAFGREGELWLTSYAAGLFRLQPSKFVNYTPDGGLATVRVSSLHETPSGEVLVGGDGGRVQVIRDGSIAELELPEALPDIRVRGLFQDRRGRLWIASYAGLLEVDGDEATWHTTETGMPTNQVRLVYQDRSGRLWVGTRNAGLVEISDDGRYRAFDKTSGLSSDFVLSIDEGPEGQLFLGTYEGLDVLDRDGSVTTYGVAEGLPKGNVFSTFVDGDGAAWLATNSGLARLANGEIGLLTMGEGLPAESIFDYTEDDLGRAWLASSSGVIQIAAQELRAFMEGELQRVDARLFDERDGMVDRGCTGAAKVLRSGDGKLWFPTGGGVAVLDPGRLSLNPFEPPVVIGAFVVDGETIRRPATAAEKLVVEPGKRQFFFRFAALSLLAPTKVEVKYRLEGFDDDWVDAGAERSVRYTTLPHGEYSFRVIAANNDGLWNDEGEVLAFRVEPFFYQRPIVLLLFGLLAAFGAGSIFRSRMRVVRARNTQLEGIIAEQRATEKARQWLIGELEAKNAELERFTYTISHDLKSPLVTIKNFLGLLDRSITTGDVPRMRRDMQRISAAADQMGALLGDLLELSRIGHIIGPRQAVALAELVAEACALAAGPIAEGQVEVEIAPDLPTVSGDRARLLEVYQNLVENAAKHMGEVEAPRVTIGWRHDGEEPVFFVGDNGIGIEPRYHELVFGLFERLDVSTPGTGVGLALAKRIIEDHGGRLWVESEGKGGGATFCFTLPEAPRQA